MLKEQLQKQIKEQAEAIYDKVDELAREQDSYDFGLPMFYKEICPIEKGLTSYATLWQAAEEKAEKAQHHVGATIEKVIDLMEFVAEAKGHVSDEEIISQVRKSLPELLEALTPKTKTDEHS